MSEKRDSPSQKIIHNHLQNCSNFRGLSLSFYLKKWIIVFIVNKSNFICFTWFVYTFVNYKYNVLLKRDDVCLIPLSTLVTVSRFDDGKEIKIVCTKMLNVVATLQQRCGNVLITSESDVVTTSETDVCTTLIFDRVTTLWRRQQLQRCGNVVTTLLSQLGSLSLPELHVKEISCA